MQGFQNISLPSLFTARTELEKEIAAAREVVEAQLAPKKEKLAEINTDITTLAAPLVTEAYKKVEKVDGTVKFASGDAIFKSEIKKTVDYDSAALMVIAASLPWEEAQKIFKFEASIGEKVFKALPDGELKNKIIAARTVKYGTPKITAE